MTKQETPPLNKKEKKEAIQQILEKNETIASKLPNFMALGAERGLLSILLNDPEKFHQIKHSVKPEAFSSAANKRLYEIVLSVSNSRSNGNYVKPEQVIYEQNYLEEIKAIGGDKYLSTLSSTPYPSSSLDVLIKILRSKQVQRERYAEACNTLQSILSYDGHNVEDVIKIGMESHFNTLRNNSDMVGTTYKYGSKLRERLEERAANPVQIKGYKLAWFKHLTEITNGVVPRDFWVIGARPKTGKSTFLNELAVNLGIIGEDLDNPYTQNIPVAYVDSEMEDYQQEDRACSMLSEVEEKKITNGLFACNQEDADKVWKTVDIMEQHGNVYWDRLPLFDTNSIVLTFKMRILIDGCKVGFFDQIKDTMDSATGNMEKEHQRIGWLALSLKHLTEEENIPIIAAMQLGRSAEGLRKEGKDPSSVFADSDRVLRFATKCAYLSRLENDEIEKFGGIGKCGNTVLNLFANRSGEAHDQRGGIGLMFRKRITRFEEMGNLEV